jgi:hypothetical protein
VILLRATALAEVAEVVLTVLAMAVDSLVSAMVWGSMEHRRTMVAGEEVATTTVSLAVETIGRATSLRMSQVVLLITVMDTAKDSNGVWG